MPDFAVLLDARTDSAESVLLWAHSRRSGGRKCTPSNEQRAEEEVCWKLGGSGSRPWRRLLLWRLASLRGNSRKQISPEGPPALRLRFTLDTTLQAFPFPLFPRRRSGVAFLGLRCRRWRG